MREPTGRGPQDSDTMSAWEKATYEYARMWARRVDRRQLMKFAGAGAGATLMGSLLAACGDDDDDDDDDSGDSGAEPTPDESSEDPTPTPEEDDTDEPDDSADDESGGSLRIARGQESDTLDPQKTGLLVAHEIMWQIYDSLIYLDETGEVFPGLATAWEFSDDNLTVTFTLREGVRFHDGSEFNADIVKQTADRHLNPDTASPTAYMLGPLDSVEVIDDLTVAYHYSEPFVPLWVGLSYSYTAPISFQAVEEYGDSFGRNPVGTGPYKFVEWTADQTIVLEKNPEHDWATPFYTVDRGPVIDQAEFVVIPEDASRIAALQSGEVDVVAGTGAVPVDRISSLDEESGINVITRPAVGVHYATLNTQKAPLDDVRVRQAINYGVDKEKLVALVLDGHGEPAHSIVASAYGDYNPDVMKYEYDPERAMSLLEEAGADGGFEMDYLNIQSPVFQRAAEVIQEDLSQLNITLNVQSVPVAEWGAAAADQEPQSTFVYYTYSDPDIVYSLVHTGEAFAWSFQDDPELDEWLEQQRVAFDAAERTELLHQIQARCAEQAYHLYLWEGVYSAAVRDYVENVNLDLVGFIHLQEMSRSDV